MCINALAHTHAARSLLHSLLHALAFCQTLCRSCLYQSKPRGVNRRVAACSLLVRLSESWICSACSSIHAALAPLLPRMTIGGRIARAGWRRGSGCGGGAPELRQGWPRRVLRSLAAQLGAHPPTCRGCRRALTGLMAIPHDKTTFAHNVATCCPPHAHAPGWFCRWLTRATSAPRW